VTQRADAPRPQIRVEVEERAEETQIVHSLHRHRFSVSFNQHAHVDQNLIGAAQEREREDIRVDILHDSLAEPLSVNLHLGDVVLPCEYDIGAMLRSRLLWRRFVTCAASQYE
jgi:hypothetical protein